MYIYTYSYLENPDQPPGSCDAVSNHACPFNTFLHVAALASTFLVLLSSYSVIFLSCATISCRADTNQHKNRGTALPKKPEERYQEVGRPGSWEPAACGRLNLARGAQKDMGRDRKICDSEFWLLLKLSSPVGVHIQPGCSYFSLPLRSEAHVRRG